MRELSELNMLDFEIEDIYRDVEAVTFVQQALKEAVNGNMENYDEVVAMMDPSFNVRAKDQSFDTIEDKEALLVATLKALSEVVTLFDVVHHHSLHASILGMNIWTVRPLVRDALINLVVGLAASSGCFLDACLDMLVYQFVPPPTSHRIPWFPQKNEIVGHVLSALQEIATLVPLAPVRLLPIIERRMPRRSEDKHVHAVYVESLLKLESCKIGEFIRSPLLKAIVDRLLDLDVDIKWEKIQQNECNGVFEMELQQAEANVDVAGYNEDPVLSKVSREERGIETIDMLMVVMFQYLEFCKNNDRLTEVFEILVESFYKTVLTAQKSKCVQFLIFYTCSLDPEVSAVRFARRLGDTYLSNSEPYLYRICAVSYLASYISRAKFLSSSLVTGTLQRLVCWSDEYCHLVDKKKLYNAAMHRVFYSGCQAIFYILCFHMRSVLEHPQFEETFHIALNYILHHDLDPLKACIPSIVEEFVKQVRSSGIFSSAIEYFDEFLGSKLPKGVALEKLGMFFPFDPYLLNESDRFIRPNFKFWSTVRIAYNNDEIELDFSEDDEGPMPGPSSTADGEDENDNEDDNNLEYSINAMSITPKETFVKANIHADLPVRMPAKIRPL